MKKTAIDLFFDEVKQHFEFSHELILSANFAYAMAKVEEKQQIIDAFEDSRVLSISNNCNSGKQYYQETFKQD